MFQAVVGIERDAIRQLADVVHGQSDFESVVVDFDGDGRVRVALRQVVPWVSTYIFRGTIKECYAYLVGWRHATAEV